MFTSAAALKNRLHGYKDDAEAKDVGDGVENLPLLTIQGCPENKMK
jgi:hypothetical protein